MRGFRLCAVALVCLVGLLSGCAHYTHIGTDDGTVTTKANKGKPIYLRTVCSPAWASIGAANGLLLAINSLEDYWYAPIGGALVGSIVDALRCGFNPPTITNTRTSSSRAKPKSANPDEKDGKPAQALPEMDLSDNQCLVRLCAHLDSYSTQNQFKKCLLTKHQKNYCK